MAGALLALFAGAGCGEGRGTPEPERVAVPAEPIPARPGTFHGIGVVLTGLAIRADQPQVAEGDVTFSVTNSAARSFVFVVRGQGAEFRTGEIAPGGTGLLQTRLQPGVYELSSEPEQSSPVPGEIRRTLRVTAGG